jgi:SAM-dependent methyltransferase
MEKRSHARRLAQESLERGDATGWFEQLYDESAGDASVIPWADLRVNPNLLGWLESRNLAASGKSALVVGCGLGDDAEELSRRGFDVVSFDIAPTAIDWCQKRFPASRVKYTVADIFELPEERQDSFDFVFEAYTLQVLPAALRQHALRAIADCVCVGGILLVIARGRDAQDDAGAMPWPLARDEFDGLGDLGFSCVAFEDYVEQEEPPVRRFRGEYRRHIEPVR